MSSNNKKKQKIVSKPLPFKPQVKAPYDDLVGKKFSVIGSWWPDSAVADRAKQFNLVVETFTMDNDFGNGNVAPAFRLKWIQVCGQLVSLFGVLADNVFDSCFRLMTQKAPATRLLLRVCTFGGWEYNIFLKKGCHESQKAAGIHRELETIKANITRWNGVYLGLMRNIQLKEHIVDSLSTNAKRNVLAFDEEGEGVMVEEESANLAPTETEWRLAAEASVVLQPAYTATQHLQGLKNTPDRARLVIFNLFTFYDSIETKTLHVPLHPSPGSTALRYTPRQFNDLLDSVKCMARIVRDQVYNRFISKGPCVPCMLAKGKIGARGRFCRPRWPESTLGVTPPPTPTPGAHGAEDLSS